MMKIFQAFVRISIYAAVFFLLLVTFSAVWFARSGQELPHADAIFVLGAGMNEDGSLHESTLGRVAAGVELFNAGQAPFVVMTGGKPIDTSPAAGDQMAAAAIALGVPEDAIYAETGSHSTLQNALMSVPILDAQNATSVILVTEGFHMARSLAVMRWSGINVVGVKTSTAFRNGFVPSLTMVFREVLAWGFNILRVILWHVLGWIGWSVEERMPMLA